MDVGKLEEYNRLKAKVDRLREKKSRAEGALGQVKKKMKEELGASSLTTAQTILRELEDEADEAEKAYATALDAFMEEWGEKLEV